MVVIPEKLILLATPRTGSRALSAAFAQVEGAKKHRMHHIHPEDVDISAESLVKGSSSLPRYTVIRDPYEQARSMFYHAVVRPFRVKKNPEWQPNEHLFLEFLGQWRGAWWFDEELYPYKNHADEFFVYDQDLQFVAEDMALRAGIWPTPVVHEVGRTEGILDSLITARTREAINERFKRDVEFYYDLLGHREF